MIQRILAVWYLVPLPFLHPAWTVRTRRGTTDWFQIGKRVRQGCILSPCLFNLYTEQVMRYARLDEAQAGIRISRRNINNFRYADDTTLMAESEEELKSLLKVKVKSLSHVRLFATPWTVPARFLCAWHSPGKKSHSLFLRTFLTQGLNLGLLHCRQIHYWLSCLYTCLHFLSYLTLCCS